MFKDLQARSRKFPTWGCLNHPLEAFRQYCKCQSQTDTLVSSFERTPRDEPQHVQATLLRSSFQVDGTRDGVGMETLVTPFISETLWRQTLCRSFTFLSACQDKHTSLHQWNCSGQWRTMNRRYSNSFFLITCFHNLVTITHLYQHSTSTL